MGKAVPAMTARQYFSSGTKVLMESGMLWSERHAILAGHFTVFQEQTWGRPSHSHFPI